jgi:SRSO17 transposase
MERRFARRKQEMLAECEVCPELLRDVQPRLGEFLAPFSACLCVEAQRVHALEFCQGLLSKVERKNVESIAYQHDQDRRNLQHFIGTAEWNHQPMLDELCRQVGSELGEPDGVLVIDPSAFPKQGKKSVGVARQWCGRLGKLANCQVGVYLAYVSRQEHALCDFRLFLPEVWTRDRRRCRAVGVPKTVRHRTRHELALEMICARRGVLPHRWVTADGEFGKVTHFRRDLHALGERYLLSAPDSMTVRILDSDELPRCGPGMATARPFVRIARVREELPKTAWQRIDVRDAEKGPLVVEVAVVPHVQTKGGGQTKYAERLVLIRYEDTDGAQHDDSYFSDAPADTPAAEFARVAAAEHRVEECLRRGKSEAGLADYEVQKWIGWHHHQTLSLIATWFLVQETRRGKKIDTGADDAATATDHRATVSARMEPHEACLDPQSHSTPIAA